MKAKFPGRCQSCRGPITEGQDIRRHEPKGYEHTDCTNLAVASVETYELSDDKEAGFKQRKFISDLMLEREIPAGLFIPTEDEPLGMASASRIIDALLDSPRLAIAQLPGADRVPAGRYAIEVRCNGDSREFVLRVWRKGHGVRCYNEDTGVEIPDKAVVLRAIDQVGAGEAAKRYGQLRGRCGHCNKRLRKKLSVELGTGPDCLNHYYPRDTAVRMRADARAEIRARGEDPEDSADSLGQTSMELVR